jgi:peroxiredoxin
MLKLQRSQEAEKHRIEEKLRKQSRKRILSKTIKLAIIIVIVTAVLYVAVSLWSQNSSPQQNTPSTPEISGPAPLFTIQDINGTQFSLNDFKGKIIVLHFMGNINDEEIDEIGKLCPVYCGENMVAISVTGPTCECTKIQLYQMREVKKVTWFLGQDDTSYTTYNLYAKYITSHGEPYFPTVVLIDKNLNVKGAYGFVNASTLSSEIESLINQ